MTKLATNASNLRDMLCEIWRRLNEVNQLPQILGVDYTHLVAVGSFLRATATDPASLNPFSYNEVDESGRLLVAAVVMYDIMGVLCICRDYRHALEQRLKESAGDLRELQAGPVGPSLLTHLPIEG